MYFSIMSSLKKKNSDMTQGIVHSDWLVGELMITAKFKKKTIKDDGMSRINSEKKKKGKYLKEFSSLLEGVFAVLKVLLISND